MQAFQSQATQPALIPSTTRLGFVSLTVANLERQIAFYTNVLGMHLHWQANGEAALGTEAEVLLHLHENPAAQRAQRATGMYHFAVLYPNRKELARALARLLVLRYPNSPTDHGVSKTTYLDDLEGNTIELYVRSLDDGQFEIVNGQIRVRHADGRVSDGRAPLDVRALLQELDEDDRLDLTLPEGTRLGHMHLYASSLERSMQFYAHVLGFQPGPVFSAFRMGEVALDEQQPHVVAFNTWMGEGVQPAPANALGMRFFTVVLPDAATLQQVVARAEAAGLACEPTAEGILVRDPSHLAVVLTDRMPATQRG